MYYVVQKKLDTFDIENILEDIKGKTIRYCIYPRSDKGAISAKIPDEHPQYILHPKNYTHFLSIVHVDNLYYVGLAPKSFFFSFDNAQRVPTQENVISRSYYKLMEAVERTPIKLDKSMKAVDIGAAPGGWTQFLSQYCGEVVAIDPAELKIPITPSIKHMKMKGEEALLLLPPNSYDLLVCDINREGTRDLFAILEKVQGLCKEGAKVIVTLKMHKKSEKGLDARLEFIKEEFLKRFPTFEVLKTIWLVSNTYERCLIAQKKMVSKVIE